MLEFISQDIDSTSRAKSYKPNPPRSEMILTCIHESLDLDREVTILTTEERVLKRNLKTEKLIYREANKYQSI